VPRCHGGQGAAAGVGIVHRPYPVVRVVAHLLGEPPVVVPLTGHVPVPVVLHQEAVQPVLRRLYVGGGVIVVVVGPPGRASPGRTRSC